MENNFTAIFITLLIPVVVLLLEHFVIVPIIKSKWGTSSIDSLKDKFDKAVQFTKGIFPNLITALKALGRITLEIVAYFFVVLIFAVTFLWNAIFPYLEEGASKFLESNVIFSSKEIIVLFLLFVWYLVLYVILGFLKIRIRQVSRVILTVCILSMTLSIFSSLHIYGYELLISQANFPYLSIVLVAVWSVALIVLNIQNKQFEHFDDSISFLENIPEVSSLIKQESMKLTEKIQKNWLRFINSPWADDYISSIKNCVPVKCEGYLLTIGYKEPSEEAILQKVQGALTEDIRAFYKIKKIKIKFERIEDNLHKEILSLIN